MMSSMMSSTIERRPRAPVSFALAILAISCEGLGGELDVGPFHLEEPAVLLDQGVPRLGHDLDQGVDVQRHQRADDRQSADELGDHAEFEQVVGGDLAEQLAQVGVLLGLRLAAEADRLAADAPGDDVARARRTCRRR